MTYLLSKLLPVFFYPVGMTIVLCVLAAWLLYKGFRLSAIGAALMAAVLLWVSSTGVLADYLMGGLERDYPPVAVQRLPSADVIVVLGGMTRGIATGSEISDLTGPIDRLLFAAMLYKAQKAPWIILSGGSAEGVPSEAELMQAVIQQFGVPGERLVLEKKSRNTYQNALNTVQILHEHRMQRVLLVTSAFHMRRAQAVFEALGVNVIPAPTDYQVVNKVASVLDWLPCADALDRTTQAIKEYLGWWAYSLCGWI